MTKQSLLDMLPEHFSALREMQEIAEVEGKQFDNLYNSIDDLLDQVFIVTATWGLDYWEEQYLLPVLSEDTDYEKRRRRVLTKKRSNKASLIDILRAIEPTIDLGWGGLTIPFYILSNTDHYDFGELVSTLEVEKPSHLSYSFNLRPNGYTVKAERNARYSIALRLVSGTARAGRYPKANTRGETLRNIINLRGQEITGVADWQRSAGLVSGGKGVQSSFGTILESLIRTLVRINVGSSSFYNSGNLVSGQGSSFGVVKTGVINLPTMVVTGDSELFKSGEKVSGEVFTDSFGASVDTNLAMKIIAKTGSSSFPCGSRSSGEGVA